VPTEAENIQRILAAGRYDATADSEAAGRRLLRLAMPDAVELLEAVSGQPYPNPPPGCKKWYQLHPAEPTVGNDHPHFKYADWTRGKKGQGGSWGHINLLAVAASVQEER
jgi:hypothetical protein